MSIWLIWGQEDFNIENKLAELKKKYVVPEFASMSYKFFTNPSFDELAEILCTPPFMFGSLFIVINCENYFSGSKKEVAFSDKDLKKLDEIFANLNENTHVAFVYKIPRDVPKKIDTRRKLYKTIAKYAEVIEYPQFRSYDKELVQWIKKQAKTKDINCNDACAKLLVEVCGVNLRVLDGELEKLKLSIYPSKDINDSTIKEICNPVEDVFKIIDLYLENKRDCALNELKKLNEKQHYLITLASINTTVRKTLNLKLLSKNYSAAQISQQTGMHEYRVKLQLEKLNKVSENQLITLKNKLTRAEYMSRSGLEAEMAIEMAFI